ncbi:Polysaccharide biosynthesis protein [Tindallia californiensis]|uniref:Polysaccharide biosynthesis protein n=1 Tax=Tindallia californiensis TaxID=159292 RepID=A0A1H3PDD1_9FIRM|nr:Polysaccharide biosynthesis protein [Tindallia californiensis]
MISKADITREVEIEDLLGRDPVNLDIELISSYICERTVMITGAGGSIGSELCRQIAEFRPAKLVMLDIYENHLYELQLELRNKYPNLTINVWIGSVRDMDRVRELFFMERPEVVFHAAAHKHVPLMEDSPVEAIKNNVFGTKNVAISAHEASVKKCVMISTDKAVNPTSVMGASKRLAEMVVQALDEDSETEFVSVRFGNVLGSSGSVIPLFKKQIAEGGPLTVTHQEMIRYFMTIPEAVQLVIQAGGMACGGEVFVLDMGEPVRIMDLAENLIRLSGFEPGEDIDIKVTGLRPGEKLFEELLLDTEEMEATVHKKIYIEKPLGKNWDTLNQELCHLSKKMEEMSMEEVKKAVMQLIDSYDPTGRRV